MCNNAGKHLPMNTDLFLRFRAYKYFPIWLQVLVLLALFVATVIVFTMKGSIHGMPLEPSTYISTFYEELLFRGFILGHVARRWRPWSAIVVSSILFGLWHLKNAAFGLPVQELWMQVAWSGLILGPIFAALTLKMRSLWLAMMLHFAWNLIAVGFL